MTPVNINKLGPGLEIDTMIHREIFAEKRAVSFFSTSISAAWRIVEEMADKGYIFIIKVVGDKVIVTCYDPKTRKSRMYLQIS